MNYKIKHQFIRNGRLSVSDEIRSMLFMSRYLSGILSEKLEKTAKTHSIEYLVFYTISNLSPDYKVTILSLYQF
jgi:hypothetical protein